MIIRSTRWLSSFVVLLGATTLVAQEGRNLNQLEILRDRYPRAFFFRAAEQAWNANRFPTYNSWEPTFRRLQGIMGKCLDEECLGREARNPEFFRRFKAADPTQAVLLHFNGNARDPRYHTARYFPGHWIYRRASPITKDVPAEWGETVIHVDDTSLFHLHTGRYGTSNDDIGLFGLKDDGTHDWHQCEHVQLVDVDVSASTITVRRGCYGTQPRAFAAGRSRAAAHAVEGPWGRENHLMWFYNFTSHCPRDPQGRACADLLIDDLAEWFGPDGPLAAFDGIEFDVMHNQTRGDTNGDGEMDDGVINGTNAYAIGMIEFARGLRERMGENFILQGDGALGPGGIRSQRACRILNGIESEGWPNLNDWEFDDWSGGLNRHFFWQANSRAPHFSYVNHKWNQPIPGQPGAQKTPDVSFARHRLVFAACQFFDAAICYSFAPANDPDGQFGVWDELRCGVDQQVGWLGRPLAPAVRLARSAPDLLRGQGTGPSLNARIAGQVTAQWADNGMVIANPDPRAEETRFTIRDVPTNGSDLYVSLEMCAEPLHGYPREMPRFAQLGISGGIIDLMAQNPREIGMKLRGTPSESPLDPASGASFHEGPRTIAGQQRKTFFVHPPFRRGTGYSFWTQQAHIAEDRELRFNIGMGPKSPERSDGVQFEVHVAEISHERTGPYKELFRHTTNQHKWSAHAISLARYAGKDLRFKFVADCGPHDDATTDHAHWAEVQIVRTGATEAEITKGTPLMTWVTDRPFPAGFYFWNVRSKTVDVSIEVEGSEPVVIRSLTAHAHPDAIYREFDRGIVLANPGRQPFTFDLQQLTPGKTYRRIQGVVTQDPQTNNGRPVERPVTLDGRDGLFLLRAE